MRKKFYKSLNGGGPPYHRTWRDNIAYQEKLGLDKKQMEARFRDTPCKKCRTPCIVNKTKSDHNNNKGKWFIKCPIVYGDGHTFQFVGASPHAIFS